MIMAEVKDAPKPRAAGAQEQPKETPSLAERDVRRAARLARRASSLAMRAGSPFAFIRRFAEEMDRLVEDFGLEHGLHLPGFLTRGHELLRREAGLVEAEWSPHIDVKEHDGRLLVRADLPGLTKDEIKVEVIEDTLTIQGERKEEKKEEGKGYCYSECSYGRFYRAIPLPEGVDTTKVTAEFQNGVLEVSIPLPSHDEPQARRVEVQEKK
jgi:HSP20 family protein